MTNHTSPASDADWSERDGHLVLGAMVRTLGSFPSGWRYPGAHNDPSTDPRALKRLALAAEKAGFDYLFLGDWLATDPELEFSDPHLLSRVDSMSTAAYLAAITRRIGLVGTVETAHSEPYATARAAASIDRLSGGRFGLNLTVGSDAKVEANFGPSGARTHLDRFDVADEYVTVLRGLWDTWGENAFTRNVASAAIIDRSRVTPLEHVGPAFAVAGPLNVQRPVQGHVPLVHAGTSRRAQQFAAEQADIYVVAPTSLGDAAEFYHDTRARVEAAGRAASALTIVALVLPIVGETRADAWAVYDRLVDLFPVDDGTPEAASLDLPANRNIRHLRQVIGLPLVERRFDEAVTPGTASRFTAAGARLVDVVTRRSGRTIGGKRPVTYRHLLVAHLIRSPIVVGSPADIADHLETWFRASAVDGFNVLNAFLHEQFETFARLVVPELRSRGLIRDEYEATTLRGHLGSPLPTAPLPALAAAIAPTTRTD
ncbi:LLM class flavin-dependent oxidoreductase [Cryobacterium sp. MDB1-18-2]|uniref:NtaA/DmoA family FMN-dependent monooxygenase n=1 Tax=unclassified Cryobacterium TaxID=2649013 RepID=UPI00106BE1B0|nr:MULTISPECIES: NtaA/DmoA family FMN-dependent monooxygenase [unclassified Cryobacterium]TFC25813.1 LLM class flavin-dependent oxidoreductase [Cryobacterium sp. MDB1-18-2]TFC45644.1 LLM class flavin-dependent oxidoreductase [Cryobacterium sp. MDB1-18-1]